MAVGPVSGEPISLGTGKNQRKIGLDALLNDAKSQGRRARALVCCQLMVSTRELTGNSQNSRSPLKADDQTHLFAERDSFAGPLEDAPKRGAAR